MADEEQTPTETAPAEEAAVPVEGDAAAEPAAEPAAETEAAPEPGEPEGEGAAEAVPTEDPPAEGGEAEAPATEAPADGEPAADAPVEGAADETKPDADAEAAPEGAEEGQAAEATEEGADGAPAEATNAEGEAAAEGEVKEGEEAAPPADGEAAPPTEDGAEGEAPAGEEGEPAADGEGNQTPAEGTGEEEGEKPAAEDGEADIPQSDNFADGENPESPVPHVGEVLSREGSPTHADLLEDGERKFTPPIADSPRESHIAEEQFDVEALEEEIISPEQDREALVEMYHAAIAEREQLQQQNHQLQHKLAEYFKKKKTDEQKPDAVDKNEADQEQRYLKYMSQLEELRAEDEQIRDQYAMEIEELQERCDEKQQEVDAHRVKFVEFKHQVALNALNSRSGKPIPPKDIEQYLSAENKKDQEVIAVRLENIKLKNKLKKKEQQLKSKEELADGLHLIDFEQLKIENQTYNEKIEERNEELLKLRKKITNTVQVLTHLKEKLQFVQGENSLLKNKLKDVEGSVAQKRDVLTRTKQARDALRIDNHRLRQNCGLLGNEPLLRDFEERKDEADSLKDRLERLKMQHAELTLNTASVRRKIEQIKASDQL